jgi:hypothetical protein
VLEIRHNPAPKDAGHFANEVYDRAALGRYRSEETTEDRFDVRISPHINPRLLAIRRAFFGDNQIWSLTKYHGYRAPIVFTDRQSRSARL